MFDFCYKQKWRQTLEVMKYKMDCCWSVCVLQQVELVPQSAKSFGVLKFALVFLD